MRWFQAEEEPDPEFCPSLSFEHRVYGFICCLAFGVLLSLMSWLALFEKNWTLFGLLMSVGNITSIAGSCFLAGPMRQAKMMFKEHRLIATCVYLGAVALTAIVAVTVKMPLLVILLCIIQYMALVWYGLSYIPFARSAVKGCFRTIV